MNKQPLILRAGLAQPGDKILEDSQPVLEDSLGAVLEVVAGVTVSKQTKLTEVRKETTDDN